MPVLPVLEEFQKSFHPRLHRLSLASGVRLSAGTSFFTGKNLTEEEGRRYHR